MVRKRKTVSGIAKLCAVILSVCLLGCCAAGCGKIESQPTGDAAVWYAPATQKVRPQTDKSAYADFAATKLDIKTGKAEYESGQIIITTTHDIKSYDLEVFDLTLEGNADVKFPKSNVAVYNQKYITVENPYEYDNPSSTSGEYPDALVPMDSAKKYGENSVKLAADEKERNQGLWVTFHTPADTAAGTYTGNFKLVMDGKTVDVPVSLTVWDFDFAKNYTAENCFIYENSYVGWGELDTSQDMYDAYGDALLEFRLQPNILVSDLDICKDEDVEFYADEVLRRASDPRCTVVFMPYKTTRMYYDGFDVRLHDGYLEKMLDAYVERSLSSYDPETGTGINILAKTRCYLSCIDEPQLNGLEGRAQAVMKAFKALRSEIHTKYMTVYEAEQATITDEKERAFRKEVYDAIDDVQGLVTAPYDEAMSEVETWCPMVSEYDTPEQRAQYADDDLRWWYTCWIPKYPYPTYHIDDTNGLMSSRLMSWMQADYGVVGNLYFMVMNYRYSARDGDRFLEDAYASSARSYLEANGDGLLFYPGKRYGLNEPIATMRLHSIRDGLEEYETLTALKSIYGEISEKSGEAFDFANVYALMSETLYEGTKCRTQQAFFDRSRELMANLAMLGNMGGAVSDIEIRTAEKKIVMELVLPEGLTLDAGETAKTETVLSNGYKKCTLVKDLSDTSNMFDATVTADGKSVSVHIYLGGKITATGAADLYADITVQDDGKPTESDLVVLPEAGEARLLQLHLPATDVTTRQQIVLGGAFMENFGVGTQKVVFRFYYAGEQSLSYALQFKYVNDPLYSEVTSGTLKHGWNEITVNNLFAYSWGKTGALRDIRILFGNTEAEANEDIYFGAASVYFI